MEEGEYVLGLFLDFSKAFDTVNHTILINKLETYGIRGIALDWIKSYLTSREQYVAYNNHESSRRCITCGVPQGSILGPILFLLYINDLAFVSKKIFSLFFADDSNLFLSGKNPNELINTMNDELVNIIKWLEVNKLSLNIKKTHYIIFRKPKSKLKLDNKLFIKDTIIDSTKSTKFLGVIIDQNLSFGEHLTYIKGKVSRGIGIVNRGKRLLNNSTLRTLYMSFLQPYLTYCITVWGKTFKTLLDPLVKLQKRAIRTICNVNYLTPSAPLFKELNVFNFRELYIYNVQLFCYKHNNHLLPDIFRHFFTFNNSTHTHLTRHRHNFRVPLSRTNITAKNIRCTGVHVNNYFSNYLTETCTYDTYKLRIKRYMRKVNVLSVLET